MLKKEEFGTHPSQMILEDPCRKKLKPSPLFHVTCILKSDWYMKSSQPIRCRVDCKHSLLHLMIMSTRHEVKIKAGKKWIWTDFSLKYITYFTPVFLELEVLFSISFEPPKESLSSIWEMMNWLRTSVLVDK